MKILIISPVGESVHIGKIPMALAQHEQVEVTVIAPEMVRTEKAYEPTGWIRLMAQDEVDGYHLAPVSLKNPNEFDSRFEPARVKNLLRSIKPDIIQVWSGPASEVVCQTTFLKLLTTPKSKVVFYGFDNLPIALSALRRIRWKIIRTQIAGGIEADGEAVDNVRKIGFKGPLEKIFWGVLTDSFKPLDKPALKKKLGLDYELIIGYVGRLVPEKGLASLLAAIRHLPVRIHCVIIGSGPMQAELELWASLPELKGRIHFFGPMPASDIVEYMNCMDVLALPSLTTEHWKEQYGRVIGEAMACGLPVVGSDSGAIPEVIGGAGMVFREADVLDLVRALEEALFDSETRTRIIKEGLYRAQHELSIDAMAGRLLDFYSRLLEK